MKKRSGAPFWTPWTTRPSKRQPRRTQTDPSAAGDPPKTDDDLGPLTREGLTDLDNTLGLPLKSGGPGTRSSS